MRTLNNTEWGGGGAGQKHGHEEVFRCEKRKPAEI